MLVSNGFCENKVKFPKSTGCIAILVHPLFLEKSRCFIYVQRCLSSMTFWFACLFYAWNYLVGGLEHLFFFPYIWNNNPIWLIFFREVETTNQLCSQSAPLFPWCVILCPHWSWCEPFPAGANNEDHDVTMVKSMICPGGLMIIVI